MGLKIAEQLQELFDKYIGKELDDITLEVSLLRQIGDDMEREEKILPKIKKEFEETNTKLTKMLSELKNGENLDVSWRVIIDAWEIVQDVQQLQKDVGRWSSREIRDHDRLLSMLDSELEKRGFSKDSNSSP